MAPTPTSGESSERAREGHELHVLLSTDPGIEATVEEEVKERCSARELPLPQVERTPTGHGGTVSVHFPTDTASTRALLFELRSIHHILKELDLFRLPDERKDQLAAIRDRVRHLKIPEFEEAPDESFRVSCDRLGHHEFSSMDVLREAGGAVQESYGLPVDLEGYRFHLRVDLYEKSCRIGLQWTTDALSKRKRPFLPRIALKGNIAYSLLRSLGASGSDEGTLLDPFCGSGTILLEAGQVYPRMRLMGSDNYPGNIPGSDKNLRAFGVRDKIQLQEADARDLSEYHAPGSIRYIATNPPYGLRIGSGMNFYQLYSKFLEEASIVLEERGRMAVMIMKKGLFEEILEKTASFRLLEKRETIMGTIHTWLFVLEKSSS